MSAIANSWSSFTPLAYRAPLNDKQSRCCGEQLVITDDLVPYSTLSYTPWRLSFLIFDNRVYTTLMHERIIQITIIAHRH